MSLGGPFIPVSPTAPPPRRAGLLVTAIDAIGVLLERRPVVVATSLLVCAALTMAMLWPHAGEGVLRLLVIALACGYVAVRGYRALPPPLDDRHSPFSRHPLVEEPAGSPLPLRRLEKLFERVVGQGEQRRAAIPGPVRMLIREEAERRLSDRGRLDLNDPNDHARIQALVGAMTWEAIRPPPRMESRLSAGGGGAPRRAARTADHPVTAGDRGGEERAVGASAGPPRSAAGIESSGGLAANSRAVAAPPGGHSDPAPAAAAPSAIPLDHLESILDDLERL